MDPPRRQTPGTKPYTLLASTAESYTPTQPFSSAQWTHDNAALITTDLSHTIRLHHPSQPLHPAHSYTFAEPVTTHAVLPRSWPDAATGTPVYFSLHAQKQLPIQLAQLPSSPNVAPRTIARYPWVADDAETWHLATALAPAPAGESFAAGAKNLLAIFDVDRPDAGPVWEMSAVGFTKPGPLTALAIGTAGPSAQLLAAGSANRAVVLADPASNTLVTAFSLRDMQSMRDDAHERIDIRGAGATDVRWSPCGAYLYLFERQAGGGVVFDVRRQQRLGLLVGRRAASAMRMGVAVLEEGGPRVLAGGVDGVLREWADVHRGGVVKPAREVQVHEGLVNSVAVDAERARVVTAAGSRRAAWDERGREEMDYSVRTWERTGSGGQVGEDG